MTGPEATHNQFAYSVSEISGALKRVVEDNFGSVRVRGEISGWKLAASGHAYLKLKDENAVLDGVCWKGIVGKMPFKPEDGMEVVCSGRITTYPGRSNYQIVIDFMEPAGLGALMALLDKRKKALAAEGLFDEKRKKPLPFMPAVIGIVTSPTGAVIRDILHRLSDRFPCHVLVWPVLVQGEGAAEQIARAIEGFNAITEGAPPPVSFHETSPAGSSHSAPPGMLPRPDLIIVARGGGSLEDLWAFNEEIVVRAAAASAIPLISAVGHETDTTLIDYASDRRAPTPTAAAEIAVPVLGELRLTLLDLNKRLAVALMRGLQMKSDLLQGLARGLPHPRRSLDLAAQRLDDWSERLGAALPALLTQKSQQLAVAEARLQPKSMMQGILRHGQDVIQLAERAHRMMTRMVDDRNQKLSGIFQLLQSLDYKRVLARGYAVVKDENGRVISDAAKITPGQTLGLELRDGMRAAKAT
jgi:exodeoxyribonuclease VII large subunit